MKNNYRDLPPRWDKTNNLIYFSYISVLLFFIWSIKQVGLSPLELLKGVPYMIRLLSEMLPPNFSRIFPLLKSILETLQIAFVGTFVGILGGFSLAIFAAKDLSPIPKLYKISRGLIAFFRTIPDLIWAIFFVATIGLGTSAGTLTIIVDTIGFSGRFFAEAMEEIEKKPQKALEAIGISKIAIIFCSVLPEVLPSFINTSLFSLEKAVRSSVVLGLVGAGGIGIELKVAMEMFNYDQASTILILIFILVIIVEQLSVNIRNKYINN